METFIFLFDLQVKDVKTIQYKIIVIRDFSCSRYKHIQNCTNEMSFELSFVICIFHGPVVNWLDLQYEM